MSECIFCKIIAGDLPCQPIYEDECCLAFNDIYPKAKTHVLLIPKKHIASLAHLTEDDAHIMGQLSVAIPKVAKLCGLEAGFRTIINTGDDGGQEVYHVHYHILGGQRMPFPNYK